MHTVVSIGDRKFIVIRKCRSEFMTDELREMIKLSNGLINIVLSDRDGNLLFCHEPKDAVFRDLTEEELQNNNHVEDFQSNE